MAVQKVISRVNMNGTWQAVNLKDYNDCYIIAIKEKANKVDTIDVNSIKKIRFEIGIDSGIKNSPLTIQYFNMDFNDITSGNNEINKITAFTRLLNIPNEFYLRVVSVDDGLKEIKQGETSISININAMNLG